LQSTTYHITKYSNHREGFASVNDFFTLLDASHAEHICGVLLRMSHIWYVCLFVGHTVELCKDGWNHPDAGWGAHSCWSTVPCIRWGQDRTIHS